MKRPIAPRVQYWRTNIAPEGRTLIFEAHFFIDQGVPVSAPIVLGPTEGLEIRLQVEEPTEGPFIIHNPVFTPIVEDGSE